MPKRRSWRSTIRLQSWRNHNPKAPFYTKGLSLFYGASRYGEPMEIGLPGFVEKFGKVDYTSGSLSYFFGHLCYYGHRILIYVISLYFR
ncbi:hypothetical protein D3C81_980790 [compost metagenome]